MSLIGAVSQCRSCVSIAYALTVECLADTLPARARVCRMLVFPVAFLVGFAYFPYCDRGPRLCLFHLIFGRACVGCGMTRALCYLAHGYVQSALLLNPSALPVAAVLLWISVKAICESLWRRWRLV